MPKALCVGVLNPYSPFRRHLSTVVLPSVNIPCVCSTMAAPPNDWIGNDNYLFHKHHFARLHKIACVDSIEVHATGETLSVELCLVIPRFHLAVLQ